ncbi:MAG TPA: hypothetical protein VI685_08075 [Candidatus Angelobacter sp.]
MPDDLSQYGTVSPGWPPDDDLSQYGTVSPGWPPVDLSKYGTVSPGRPPVDLSKYGTVSPGRTPVRTVDKPPIASPPAIASPPVPEGLRPEQDSWSSFHNFLTSPNGLIRGGLRQAVGGVERMAQPGAERKLEGIHQIASGVGQAALPAALGAAFPFALTNPVTALSSIGGGMAGSTLARVGAESLDASPAASDVASDVGGLLGLFGGGRAGSRFEPSSRQAIAGLRAAPGEVMNVLRNTELTKPFKLLPDLIDAAKNIVAAGRSVPEPEYQGPWIPGGSVLNPARVSEEPQYQGPWITSGPVGRPVEEERTGPWITSGPVRNTAVESASAPTQTGPDQVLLDQIAKQFGGAKFAKLTPDRQAIVLRLANKIQPSSLPTQFAPPGETPSVPTNPGVPTKPNFGFLPRRNTFNDKSQYEGDYPGAGPGAHRSVYSHSNTDIMAQDLYKRNVFPEDMHSWDKARFDKEAKPYFKQGFMSRQSAEELYVKMLKLHNRPWLPIGLDLPDIPKPPVVR